MYSTRNRVNRTEARLLSRRLGFGPANQIIQVTPRNFQILPPVSHYHLASTQVTKNRNCWNLDYHILGHVIDSGPLPFNDKLVECIGQPIRSKDWRVNGTIVDWVGRVSRRVQNICTFPLKLNKIFLTKCPSAKIRLADIVPINHHAKSPSFSGYASASWRAWRSA